MPNIKKAFQVKKLDGKMTKVIYDYREAKNKNGKMVRQRIETKVELDAGWMVFFPTGSSIRVTSPEEMKRLGFMAPNGRVLGAPLVDMESGEVVGKEDDTDLERLSEQVVSKGAAKKEFRNAELGIE